MFLTPEKYSHEDGIQAVELSKLLDMPVETVKRKLKILFDKGIIRVRGINPKLWKFDEFNFQRMDEDDEVYRLLCSFDDVDFDRYFTYQALNRINGIEPLTRQQNNEFRGKFLCKSPYNAHSAVQTGSLRFCL